MLGMHRSGTSLAAEIAYRWGAYADPDLFIETNDGNPRGYWEHRSLVKLNDDLLSAVHSSWKVPPGFNGLEQLARLGKRSSFRQRAQKLLATMHAHQAVWLWKDPRLCILLPFWKEVWEGMTFLVPIRDPSATSSSLCARRNFSRPAALMLWQRYMSALISDEEVGSKALFFSYDELLQDNLKVCDRICRFLDRNTGRDELDRQHRLARMAQSVQPELNRNNAAPVFSTHPDALPSQRDLYRALTLLAEGIKVPAANAFPMPAGWRELLIKNALDGHKGEAFHGLRKLFRPAKWRATAFLQQLASRST